MTESMLCIQLEPNYLYRFLFVSRRLFGIVTEIAQLALVVAPVLVDFYEGLEEYLLAEELFEALPRLHRHLLQRLSLMSDDNSLLRVALNIDDSVDMYDTLVLLEPFDDDLNRIRYLLVIIAQYLLTDNLRDEELRRFVGELVLVEICRILRQKFLYTLHQDVNTELIRGRDGKDLRIGQQRMPLLDEGTKAFVGITAREFVNLVDKQNDRYGHLTDAVEEILILLGIFYNIGNIKEDVSIGKRTFRELKHHLLHLVVRLENAGSVGEYYLAVSLIDDTHDTMARGLGLERGNGNLLADELIHQRTLTDIRIAYYIYKSCFEHCFKDKKRISPYNTERCVLINYRMRVYTLFGPCHLVAVVSPFVE